jgi:hypothetical protein
MDLAINFYYHTPDQVLIIDILRRVGVSWFNQQKTTKFCTFSNNGILFTAI